MKFSDDQKKKIKVVFNEVKYFVLWIFLFYLALNGWMRIADNNTECFIKDMTGEYIISYDAFKDRFCEYKGILNTGMKCDPDPNVRVHCKHNAFGFWINVIKSTNF